MGKIEVQSAVGAFGRGLTHTWGSQGGLPAGPEGTWSDQAQDVKMAVDGSEKIRNKAREAGRCQTLEGQIRSSDLWQDGWKDFK